MLPASSNIEELFRFASPRSPSASARRDTIGLADDSEVAAWVAAAGDADFNQDFARLAGRTPEALFQQLQDASRGTSAALAAQELQAQLWKLYLQGLASGKAGVQLLQRCQQMIAMATLMQALAADAALEATPALLSDYLGRKLRLPASFEQELHARRDAHIADNAKLEALRTRLATLEQLETSLAAALGEAAPGEPALPGVIDVRLDKQATPVDMEHVMQPAADPDAQFHADHAPLLAALAAAGLPAARLSGPQLLDEVRRQLAQAMLALDKAAAPAPKQAGRFAIRALGVADLRSVRQVLVKYDKGELAHVENVLQGETRERTHERYQRVEEGSFSWTEKENENTRDNQSTDRFELSRETRNAVYDFSGSQSGVNVSENYGDVSVNAYENLYSQRSTEQALTEAIKQSREIVNRAVERVRSLVVEQRYRSSVVEVRETTRHTQTAGDENVVGQYFWIDKVCQAQVYNYGARVMYELTVPRPAAMYTQLQAKPQLAAGDITEVSWLGYAERFGVSLPPPPPLAITEYANVAFSSRDKGAPVVSGAFGTQARTGYLASHAGCSMAWFGVKDQCGITASIGNQLFSSGKGAIPVRYLGSDSGTVSFNASAWGPVQQYTVNFFLVWQRTQRALEQWQQACYKMIMDDYERRLAARPDAAMNAGQMRTIERNELRRAVLENVRSGAGQAAAREVRFVEQAFEWDQMTYRFHPCFWDRDASGFRREGDAVFTAFLNAGFASVILPVRSGYEDSAALYLHTCVVAEVDVAPADEALAAMNAEVAGRNALPGEAIAEGEPWTYRVPTSLVVLEEGLNLPLPDFSDKL